MPPWRLDCVVAEPLRLFRRRRLAKYRRRRLPLLSVC